MAITGLAIAAALAAAKTKLIDEPQQDRQRKLAAATQQLSPWTGNKANFTPTDSLGSNMLQFGAAGAQAGAAHEQAGLDRAAADRLNSGGNLNGYGKDLSNGNTTGYTLGNNYSYKSSPWSFGNASGQ